MGSFSHLLTNYIDHITGPFNIIMFNSEPHAQNIRGQGEELKNVLIGFDFKTTVSIYLFI